MLANRGLGRASNRVVDRSSVLGRARRAASIVRDLFDVVREVNEWRHERDAFVAKYIEETRRAGGSRH